MASQPPNAHTEGQSSSTTSSTAKPAFRSPTTHREETDDEATLALNFATFGEAPQSPSPTFDVKAMEALLASKLDAPANSDKETTTKVVSSSEGISGGVEKPDCKFVVFPVQPFDPKGANDASTAGNTTKASKTAASGKPPSSERSAPYDLQREAASWLAARKAASAVNPPHDPKLQNGKVRKKPINESSAFHQAKVELGRQCGPQTPPAIAKAIQDIPFWPEEYDYSATEDEVENYDADLWRRVVRGRKRALKRQLLKKVDASWPPKMDDVNAEVDLMRVKYIFDDIDFIQAKAARENKPFHRALPYPHWFLESVETLLAIIGKYKEYRSPDPFCPKFKAAYMAMNARTLLGDIIPPQLVGPLTNGKYNFKGPGGGIRPPGDSGAETAGGSAQRKDRSKRA